MVLAVTAEPGAYLEEARAMLPLIRANAAAGEAQARLTDDVLDAFRASRFRRMLILPDHGGGGVRLPDLLPVSTTLASGDGATGWALLFAMVGPLFGQLLERSAYDEIFSNPDGAIAGALNPMGVFAEEADGGYVLTGKTSYNSAHRLATHLFFGGMVRRDGQPVFNNGAPEIRGFVVPKEQARITPNWNASAMVATESDDAAIEGVFVPRAYSFSFFQGGSPWCTGAESLVPPVSAGPIGIASIAVGAARGALDAFREMAVSKVPAASMARLADQPVAQIALAEAEGIWMAANAVLQDTARATWEKVDAEQAFSLDDAARLRLAIVTSARLSRRVTELVREQSGMSAILKPSAIDRACRDVGAVTQHVGVAAARFHTVGRVLMGLPPESLIV
jgi:alkylation response protein AidB-like acyl-CoA dehydrogenase